MREGATTKMAKYTRYDPRNKNKGKQKERALSKDVKIKDHINRERFRVKSTEAENVALQQKEENDAV